MFLRKNQGNGLREDLGTAHFVCCSSSFRPSLSARPKPPLGACGFPGRSPPLGLVVTAEAPPSVGLARARDAEVRAGCFALPCRPASPTGTRLVPPWTVHRFSGGATRTGKGRGAGGRLGRIRGAPGAAPKAHRGRWPYGCCRAGARHLCTAPWSRLWPCSYQRRGGL